MARTTTARTVPRPRNHLQDAEGLLRRRRGGRRPALRALIVLLLCCSIVPLGAARADAVTDVAFDSFDRTVTSGLGTSGYNGGPEEWTVARAASDFSVSDGAAHLKVGRGLTRSAYLENLALTEVEAATTFSTTTSPTGGGVFESLVVRRRDGSDYNARLVLRRTGEVKLAVFRGETALKTVLVDGLTVTRGIKVRVRLQATGTNPTVLRARAWRVGVAEPSRWRVISSDSTSSLQGAGSVGVRSYLSASATSAPVVTDVDDVRITDITDQPPQAVWTWGSPPGLTVYFDTSESRDAEGLIASHVWTFGDGTTGSGERPSHTYSRPGPYSVTLTVRDRAGATDSSTHTVYAVA